jgi:hypothetical protein
MSRRHRRSRRGLVLCNRESPQEVNELHVEAVCMTAIPAADGARAPFMILAHHRSGSNFLNDVLQAHPCMECLNEPLSMHTPYFRQCDLQPWSATEFDASDLHPSLAAHPALRDFLVDFRDYLARSNTARVLGFKETVLFGKLDWLKAFLPALKIVFLRRDPRAIVSSVLRSNLTRLWNYPELVPPAFMRRWPHYERRAGPSDAETAAAEVAAMSVAVRYELARCSLDAFDHRVVALEDLMHAPQRQLPAVAEFLGVPIDEAQLSFLTERQSATRGGVFSSFRSQGDVNDTWRRHLTPRQLAAVEAVLQAAGGWAQEALCTAGACA